ncbi:dihydrofolate reductase [Sandaracinobacter sp.]|jgi:dihydrofolate reductase|uniref:dihydrofolate reductase n=1 Tax=Sandaracinobacter sp. TaxID=2487581 RepID=UPI0035AEF616
MRPEIVLVVAAADNGVIGKDGAMPWHLPADLRRFKRITTGKPVIMGRKTFESIGKPLPGRHNIVLTRDPRWRAPGATLAPNLAEAIAAAGLDPRARADELMVIGGAEIYALARPIATRIELTRIHVSPDGDTWFPDPDPADWREAAREDHAADGDAPAHSFLTYVRR